MLLESLDCARLLQGEPDIVEPFHQAALAERVDVELDHAAVGASDLLRGKVDVRAALAPREASSISLSISSCGSVMGRMPFLKQLL